MIRRALIFDDTEDSFLFMIQTPDDSWHADLTMLEYWRTTVNTPSQINIYSIALTDAFVSINHMGAPLEWETLPFEEYDNIRSLVERSWIPTALIYTTIPIHEIVEFDQWSRVGGPVTAPAHWNAVRRPLLGDVPLRRRWEPCMIAPNRPRSQPQQQPQQPSVATLPPHVVATVIAAAIRDGTTCPITLETIPADDITVTSCGHVFTATALQRWIVTHTHCPECRNPL